MSSDVELIGRSRPVSAKSNLTFWENKLKLNRPWVQVDFNEMIGYKHVVVSQQSYTALEQSGNWTKLAKWCCRIDGRRIRIVSTGKAQV